MAKAAARGYGIKLNYDELNEESISKSLNELLNNQKYKETAVKVSKMFNDRELSPQETVVYWTEYAVRHQGAPHLKAHAVNLSFIEFYSIDVYCLIPFGSKSHFAIGNSILRTLQNAGHDVTVMTAFPSKKQEQNYREIKLTKIMEVFDRGDEVNPFIFGQLPAIMTFFLISKMNTDVVDLFMQELEVQKFLEEDKSKYDICLFEIFMVDALLGIPERYGCHLISYTTFAAVRWTDDMTGLESPASYVPNPFLKYTDKMSFGERLWNSAFSLVERFIYHFYHLPNHRKRYKKYFPDAKRSFEEMYKGSSIIFSNTHVSSSTVRPFMPNVIEIAGIHMKPAQLLPKDIQEFLDSATDGAILFSMGSFIQSKMWPVEKRDALIKAFGKLNLKVIWKYENETLPNNPGNIKISSWLPQRDILAHKNIKLFITHGGLLGTTEALVEGVPVLGLPIFGDQKMNMAKTVLRGYGLQISFQDIEEQRVSDAINELLTNPKYKENAMTVSKRFIDRPMTPQESVVYWTEYVARHDGAHHLRAYSTQLNFIEFHMFDVYGALILIALVIMYIQFLVLRAILRKIFKRKNSKSENKIKKN
ncbi:hypothetical protein PVAND_003644 [Polypedilum vanderplanki]|uniref:Glucuronosyltransferase n=1 Tax=Polypedilum vanderplanki TaxID=319348 RepID=A0A9J6BUP7_POLVA|nr:hypothetical protein PVAND_003644 [Polypedilum vanderplanki]